MCGLLGLLSSRPLAVGHALASSKALAHRGPDGAGWLAWSPGALSRDPGPPPERARVVFAHRRLAVLDLSAGGHQPMSTEDGRFHLVFNGEVYSYRELRQELEGLGRTFRSQSDTEVVLLAWAEWGPAALSRFNGMFALAVLDSEQQTVTFARDPFGIKPLYTVREGDRLAFASEVPALLELSGVTRRANPQAIYDFLRFGYCEHRETTAFAGVEAVPAAHWVEVQLSDLSSRRECYWTPPTHTVALDYRQAVARVREEFLTSVRLHLRSDVPIGAALSGGIDSSAIVCAIRQLEPEAELHAFSYLPQASAGVPSEEHWASEVSRRTRAIRHVVTPTSAELHADLDGLIRSQGEPFGSLSLYAQARVFRLAREAGVTVLLDGQGADELLGGYAMHASARLASLVGQGRARAAARFARATHVGQGARYRDLAQGVARLVLPDRVLSRGRARLDREWLASDWFAAQGVSTAPPPLGVRVGGRRLHAALRRAVQLDSLPALLRYEDRGSMAHSLESRVPFLTVGFAELCLSLPESYLIDGKARSKAVFRDAMRGLVPDSVLERRDKVGFVGSDRAWLLGAREWVRETLAWSEAVPAVDARALAQHWARLEAGGPWSPDLWRALNVVRWWTLFGC